MSRVIKEIVKQQLHKMHMPFRKIDILRNKDGVIVARVYQNKDSVILKYFQRKDFTREIQNYKILSELEIPTIHVISSTENALLLEDILCSPVYRMGTENDLADPVCARHIAKWYKKLHAKGYDYILRGGENLYSETDFFTLHAIDEIKRRTDTQNAPAWKLIEENFTRISSMLSKMRLTLTYNDFYYTNMIVAKDVVPFGAIMFDYNLLGKGYAYSDVRNVLSSLVPGAQEAFLDEYGAYDPAERILDDVVSVVVSLYFACQREQFPEWARCILETLNTDYTGKIERMLEL